MTNFILQKLAILTFLAPVNFIFAQNNGFPNENIIISDDVNIRSVNILNIDQNILLPYAKLGEQFEISFDDLDADNKRYFYKIEHYDVNWTKSDIFDNDFIEGFNEAEISQYSYSFNTLQRYTHYKFKFPNPQMKLLSSGNYLLKVYLNDPDEPAFVRRLVIYEDLVNIGAVVKRAELVDKRDTEQQVNININHKDIYLSNPHEEIKVNILQNNNWNTAIYSLPHQYIGNNTLIYNYNDMSNFEGGNFFYHFDTKSIRTAGLNTDFIDLQDIYHTYLYTNIPRSGEAFSSQQDFNGGFVIRTTDSYNSENEADYTRVHFSLSTPNTYYDSSIFVYGAFNDWRLEEENRLKYDKARDIFTTDIILKQGYYDYKFVIADNKNLKIKANLLSGSHYQTENNYTIIVYYKNINSRFYRVVGLYQLRSPELF